MWLRDGLPQALPNTRIMTYGYDSRLYTSASFANTNSYGRSLLADLVSARASPGVCFGSGRIKIYANIVLSGGRKAPSIYRT